MSNTLPPPVITTCPERAPAWFIVRLIPYPIRHREPIRASWKPEHTAALAEWQQRTASTGMGAGT